MLIPLGTDRAHRRPTVVNHILVALNIAAFVAGLLLERADPDRFDALFGALMLDPEAFRWWALGSYAFLHGGLAHILGNMVFLFVFGPNVEDRLGRLGYLLFYMLGAAIAGGAHALFYKAPVVGASGAVAAVTGAYVVLFPHTRIKVLLMFFFIGIYEIPAWWLIGGQIAWNLLAESFSGPHSRVAYLAHLGGYAWGITLSLLLLASGILRREPFDLFSISRQAARRRTFREAHYQRQRKDELTAQAVREGATAGALAEARGEVSSRIPEDLPGAAAAYRRLLDQFGTGGGSALLSRRLQYDLANHLFESGDHQTAAVAYQLFLDGYPSDPEIPIVRLMLGLINARYLNDPIRAKTEITRAIPDLPEGHRPLARELLAELG